MWENGATGLKSLSKECYPGEYASLSEILWDLIRYNQNANILLIFSELYLKLHVSPEPCNYHFGVWCLCVKKWEYFSIDWNSSMHSPDRK